MSDTTAAPTRVRMQHLDVLRGLGVMGILAVNIAAFAQPLETYAMPGLNPFPTEGDSGTVWWLTHTFFERKFVTLFSMLFGASLFLVGGERRDPVRSPILRRRLFWLLIFGLIHGLGIWYGDILMLYAVSGFIVLLARSWRPRTLIIVGAALFYLVTGLSWLALKALEAAPPDVAAEAMSGMNFTPESVAASIAAYKGGLATAYAENFENWTFIQSASLTAYLPATVGAMMIGMGLLKAGVLQGRAPLSLYLLLTLVGAGSLYLIGSEASAWMAAGFPITPMTMMGSVSNGFLCLLVSLGYVSVVALLLRFKVFQALLGVIGAVGRMAFTNYISQSVAMTTIFWSGRGFGQFGDWDRPELFMLVVTVWLIQIAVSNLWLARFDQGPLEAIWRRLSFGKAGRPEALTV